MISFYHWSFIYEGKDMNSGQDEQLKEMCITMIKLLDKLRNEGKISDEEYNEHIRVKKQFVEYLEQNKIFRL